LCEFLSYSYLICCSQLLALDLIVFLQDFQKKRDRFSNAHAHKFHGDFNLIKSISSVLMTVKNHQTVQPWLTHSGSQVIHIHRDMPIDLDEVVNIFSTKHPRRLELAIWFG
jgi:hypothetical protein